MILFTKCKTKILLNDNTLLYLKTHPGIIKILPEVFSKIFLRSNIFEYKKEIDLKKNIGFTSLKKVEQISINLRLLLSSLTSYVTVYDCIN